MFTDIASNDLMIMLNNVFTLVPVVMPVCLSIMGLKVALKWLKEFILGI